MCISHTVFTVDTTFFPIHIIIEPYPAPNHVQLLEVHPGYFIFTWSPVLFHCQDIHYNIIAKNCGVICPRVTTHSTTLCNSGVIGDTLCIFSFAIQTVVCQDIVGNSSDPVSVTLKGTYLHVQGII